MLLMSSTKQEEIKKNIDENSTKDSKQKLTTNDTGSNQNKPEKLTTNSNEWTFNAKVKLTKTTSGPILGYGQFNVSGYVLNGTSVSIKPGAQVGEEFTSTTKITAMAIQKGDKVRVNFMNPELNASLTEGEAIIKDSNTVDVELTLP